jgi:hypothetical protein
MPGQAREALGPLAASLAWEPDAADVASWLQHGHLSSSFSLARLFGRPMEASRPETRLRGRLTPSQRIVDLG